MDFKDVIPSFGTCGATILVGSGLLLSAYVFKKLTVKKYKLPPGPKPWPLVGNLLEYMIAPEKLYMFENYRKTHGNIFTLYLVKLASRDGKNIINGQFDSVWKVQRKILHGALRQYATGQHFEEKMHEAFSIMYKNTLHRIDDGPLDPLPMVTLLMYNIIYRIAFGQIYGEDDDDFKMVLKRLDSVNSLVGNGLLADYIPFMRYLPTPTVYKIKSDMAAIEQFFKQKLDDHNASYDQSCVSDLTFHIIKLREDLKESIEDRGALSQLTEDHYLGIINDFVIAGTDTSRYTLVWVILYMADHPESQRIMQTEIDCVVGSKEIKLSDRQLLPYAEAVLHEVMRLRPIAPLLLPHSTTCETSLGGYTLPPDTSVMANVMSLHMNPESFPEPKKFQPERFLDENGKFFPRPGEWMPFSAGRRVCVGESIAKVELHLLTAMLFQKFSFSAVEGENVDLSCQDIALFMFPKGQKLSIKPRY